MRLPFRVIVAIVLLVLHGGDSWANDKIVVVYPEEFEDAAIAYGAHRSNITINCYEPATITYKTLEEIDDQYGDCNGTTSESEIRSALLDVAVDGDAAFVVLMGDETIVPEPIVTVGTRSFVSDDWYVDLNSDYIGDVSIGRIPGSSSAAVEGYVAKVVEHDDDDWMTEAWRTNTTVFVGDTDNNSPVDGHPIPGHAGAAVGELIEDSLPWEFDTVGCGDLRTRKASVVPQGERHDDLVNEIEAGRGLVFGVGTSAHYTNFVRFIRPYWDDLELGEWPITDEYPIAFGLSCLLGSLESSPFDPNVFRTTVMVPNRGFVAAVAPTEGVRLPTERLVIRSLIEHLLGSPRCGQGSPALGDLIRNVKTILKDQGIGLDEATVLSHRVLGDPALRVPLHLDALRDATIVKANVPVRPGSYIHLHVEDLVDENYPTLDWGRYSYSWTTTDGRFWHPFYHWVTGIGTYEPEVDLYIPDNGSWEFGDSVNVSVEIREEAFLCNGTATSAKFEVTPLSDGGGGCPIVQAKISGVWSAVNSVLGDRVYSGTTSDTDDYLHLEPPTSFGTSPVFEVKVRESAADNHTLIDFAEVTYVEWPTGTTVLASQTGSAFECDSVVPADTSWSASGAHLEMFLAVEDTLHVTMDRGDTLYAVFDDDAGPTRVGLVGVRARDKPLLLSFDVGGDNPWGLQALEGFGIGDGDPLLPRENWSLCFADSPVVVRGDGIPDTVAWEIGEAHQLDEVFLLDGAEAWGDTATYQLQSAVHTLDGSVTTKFTADDGEYSRIDYGEDAKLTFPYPSLQSGTQREIILHLRGTYEFNGEERNEPQVVASLPWGFQTIYPNPTTGRTHIVFSGDNTTHRQLAVYDVGGRRIRKLYDGIGSAGLTRLEWDGRDDRSHSVSAGVYFIRLQEGHGRTSEKLVVLR